jgi:uncharacterized DUF497 family protein
MDESVSRQVAAAKLYDVGVMDVFVTREGQRFVWDSEKASANIAKHGVSFDRALEVFLDPFHRLEDASVFGEQREVAIGVDLARRLLFVVHLETETEQTRIVSAWPATAAERRRYEKSK